MPDADSELSEYLESEKEHVSVELEGARSEAKTHKEELEKLWADSSDAEYELCSVFIHRGNSPSWGHYFFYSRDLPNNPDQWYKYNDSEVTLVGKDEIFKDTTGSTANPYLVSLVIMLCAVVFLTSATIRSLCTPGKGRTSLTLSTECPPHDCYPLYCASTYTLYSHNGHSPCTSTIIFLLL